MITHPMLRFFLLVAGVMLCLAASSLAIDYKQLSVAKRLAAEKRYDEAIQKLEALAASTDEAGENFHYLDLAVDLALKSLKAAERALALAAEIKDAGYRDFARLSVLADLRRFDEALASLQGKNVDT